MALPDQSKYLESNLNSTDKGIYLAGVKNIVSYYSYIS